MKRDGIGTIGLLETILRCGSVQALHAQERPQRDCGIWARGARYVYKGEACTEWVLARG
jgi:hypothetical protein